MPPLMNGKSEGHSLVKSENLERDGVEQVLYSPVIHESTDCSRFVRMGDVCD
jgi:hypothetical protein